MIPLMERKIIVFILIVILLASAGCVKETYDIDKFSKQVHLSPAFGLPVVRGRVTLSDFVEPSDTIIFDSDSVFVYAEAENVITFIFSKDSIISFNLEDYYNFDDMISYSKSFVVGELNLGSFDDTIGFSLDEISMKLPPAVRDALVLLDEKTGDFPPFPAVTLDEKTYDSFANFEYATFSDGVIEITVTNNLTIPITNLNIQLYNAAGPTPVGDPFTFALINPGQSLSDSIDLEDVILSNSVIAAVSLGDNPGADDVYIDLYNSSIEIAIAGRDLTIKSGRVILPIQEVVSIDEKDTISFDPGEDIEIDEIKILSGDLNYSVNALVPIKASVTITLPSSLRDGNPVTETITVEPNTILNDSISLDNAIIYLGTISGQPYNMLPVNYGLEVSSDGQMVDFNSTDEVSIEMEMLDPGIDYVKGYFGQYGDTIDSDTIDLEIDDILGNITGTVTLYPSISLNYQNSFAIPVEIDLDAVGYKGNDSVDIDLDPEILGYPNAPAERDVNDSYTINSANSQLPELISMLPGKIRFGGSAVMNPDGNTGSRDNYIFGNSRFLGDLEIEVPLELRINNLHFADTVDNFMQDAEIDEESPVTPEDVEYLRIQFTAENGFPLGISLTMSLYDSTSASIKSTIDATDILEAAGVDSNGRVTEPAECSTELEITSEFWDAINDADKIIFNITLVTTDDGTKDVKIYSDYYIEYRVALQVKADINADMDELK
jgi:hypothetical protein